ncbi:hypothetical protein LTR05_001131 [Lithohypha guttulata]|uniref:SUZ-C domain-containing protein n=1 Tax=Lithohypha guttulata TaxID=1690604 RepID=A0AAN7T648_9EURO|nr:hypothetical protein LTR05_001131 [Lithohypha guttulata]
MSKVPDAWDDEWSTAADDQDQSVQADLKKLTTKQTKAQKRAAQAEFNRQLWAEAEGPSETNYFLESRNVVPLRQEFKPPPVLLSRKGPIIQKPRSTLEAGLATLNLKEKEESSEDEDDELAKQKALDDAKAQAARDREEKQRKYEERRLELFGPDVSSNNNLAGRPNSRSGGSSPANLTPPGSRSSTPHRGGGKRGGRGRGNVFGNNSPRAQQQQQREAYEPNYSAKPNSTYLMKREPGYENPNPNKEAQPIRAPKAPDGSGRGGAGFVLRRENLA